MRQEVQQYISSIETKDIGEGKTLYKIITNPKRLCPLGYHDSEEKAVQALEDYLIANGKI